jgi:hypothetical protein
MGRLAGFRYREIIKRLKSFGFEFDRQAAGRQMSLSNVSVLLPIKKSEA